MKPPAKRSAATEDEEEGMPIKKQKGAEGRAKALGGDADVAMRQHFEKDTIGKLSVAELKDWLHAKRLSTAGRKAELVERIEEWYEKK